MPQNILLVDDEPALLDSLQRSMRRESFAVHLAQDASAAMDVMQDRDIDVVVTDDCMPGVSGVDFVTQIRTLHPRTVRIMLTGQASIPRILQAVNEGAVFRFLTKPCQPEVLLQAVHQALDHRRLLDCGRGALVALRRQADILHWFATRHPGLMRQALGLQRDIRLREEDFDSAVPLVDELHLRIDEVNRVLEPKAQQTQI